MARKSSPPSDKGKGRKAKDSENDLSRGRAALPPPAGLDVMPRPILADDIREDGKSVVEVEASEAERAALAEAWRARLVRHDFTVLAEELAGVYREVTGT